MLALEEPDLHVTYVASTEVRHVLRCADLQLPWVRLPFRFICHFVLFLNLLTPHTNISKECLSNWFQALLLLP